jgi:hypothetical protein
MATNRKRCERVDLCDMLTNLRLATAIGKMSEGLGRAVYDRVLCTSPVAERYAARDRKIREAASLMEGTTWSRARRIHRVLSGEVDSDGCVTAYLREAFEMGPARSKGRLSMRRLIDILASPDGGSEAEAPPASR